MSKRRKKRPSTQNEISITFRLLKLHLRNHPDEDRRDALNECIRGLEEMLFEEGIKQAQRDCTTRVMRDWHPLE